MVKKVELNKGKDFNTLEELINLLHLDIKVIERNGILNIFRYVGHDNDMNRAKEEYAYLYAFTNESNHIYSEYEKLALFKKYLEAEKYNLNHIKVKECYYSIEEIKIWIGYEYNHDLMIVYAVGGFWSTQKEDENEICIGPISSSKEIHLL